MNWPFPFGFPLASRFYLVLYILTWVLHSLAAYYVLCGSIYLGWRGCLRALRGDLPLSRAESLLREWLPLAFSVAVTIAIAPLLFVQLLYQEEFYTAHVLLWTRWMPLGPALIVAFYLLYVYKIGWIDRWPKWLGVVIGVATCASFLFAAYCWTENHLMMLRRAEWPGIYDGATPPLYWPSVVLRLAWFVSIAVPTFIAVLAWQLWMHVDAETPSGAAAPVDTKAPVDATSPFDATASAAATPTTALPAAAGPIAFTPNREILGWSHAAQLGLLGVLTTSVFYALVVGWRTLGYVFGLLGLPWVALFALGCVIQVAAWRAQQEGRGWQAKRVAMIAGGVVLMLLGTAGIRETIRWASLSTNAEQMTRLLAQHERALAVAGLPLFLLFAVVNLGLCGWCIWKVRRQTA